jgi:hypothetical protein
MRVDASIVIELIAWFDQTTYVVTALFVNHFNILTLTHFLFAVRVVTAFLCRNSQYHFISAFVFRSLATFLVIEIVVVKTELLAESRLEEQNCLL